MSVESQAKHEDTESVAKARVQHNSKNSADESDEEPLIDTTEALPLHSKKLERQRRRKEEKARRPPRTQTSILDLPPELLLQILACLEPKDLLRLTRVAHSLYDFVYDNEHTIAKDLLRCRYWVLSRCFPLPVLLANVQEAARPALLDPGRQKMLVIHKKPYQHIPVIDHNEFCTCMTCLLAWNNVCLLLDFAHWQRNLDDREPIPMIPRGRNPDWNRGLLVLHSDVVKRAIHSPLVYAAILQGHLESINRTILRRSRWTKKPADITNRPYHLSEAEAAAKTDAYLERSGPPSYEFPFHRDNYYSLEAYVPNRKWSDGRWLYYAAGQHDRDVAWTTSYFSKASQPGIVQSEKTPLLS